jgi:ATP-dependent helicase/nuclease subunit A
MSAQKAFDDETYANSGADVLVRGVIDLWFEEADGIVLVDYKTDKQTDEEYYINNYDVQLELYKEALEKATGKKVKEIYIYAINVENGLIKIDR